MIPGPKAYNNPNSHFFINSAFGLLHKTYVGSRGSLLEGVYPSTHLIHRRPIHNDYDHAISRAAASDS